MGAKSRTVHDKGVVWQLGLMLGLLLCLTAPGFAQGNLVCPSNITHLWPFDETTGPPYSDLIGSSDGACISSGCPASVAGLVENGVEFDGGGGANVASDPSFDWGADADFSIELWMRKTSPCVGDDNSVNEIIVGRYDGKGLSETGNLNLWWLGINCSSADGTPGAARFVLREDTTGGVQVVSGTDVSDGQWHHLVAVRDGLNGWTYLYVDGVQEADSQHVFQDGFDATTDLNIGYLNFGAMFRYAGELDELALYDKVLSPSDIETHYERGINSGKGYCYQTPLIATSPVTSAHVGAPYAYDVDATGDPQPIYSLVVSPAGMTIDGATGLIEWVPTAVGVRNIIVRAVNAYGTDTQPFSIVVSEQSDCPDGLVHYWQLNESAGAPYDDYVGTADGSCISCPTSATGLVDDALEFDGVDNGIDVADDDSFDWGPDESFSIEFWMNKSASCEGSSTSDYNEIVVGRYGSGGPVLNLWWVGVNCNESDGTVGAPRFVLRDEATSGAMLIADQDVTDGDWHHIVAVRDGSTEMNRLYIDGGEAVSAPYTYQTGFADNVPLTLGYIDLNEYYRYDGLLDEVAMYDRALTVIDIQAHYQEGLLGLGLCEETAVAPSIISSPITAGAVGQIYEYDVEATGNPIPTYSLVTYPPEMTIDENSGLIQWTPGFTGTYDVVVAANNSQGSDEQPFQITVVQQLTCSASMQHYWMLEEENAPYVDLVGGVEAVCGDCPTPGSGVVGGAQIFDGLANELLVAEHATFDWSPTASFSIEFWLRKGTDCAGASNSENNVVIGRYGTGSGNLNIWWVGVNCNAADGPQGSVRFVLRDVGSEGVMLLSGSSIIDDAWHHVVAVHDGVNETLKLYVDGFLEDSTVYSYTVGFDDTSPVDIGYIGFGNDFRLDGTLDELAVYDEALTGDVVEAHFNSGQQGLGYCYICGDVDGNGVVNISDAVYLIAFIFGGGPAPSPAQVADADCNGIVNISDAVFLIAYIFGGGPTPCSGCP